MFISRVKVIKMSKIAHFFVSSADNSKRLATVWAKHLSETFFQKMVRLIVVGATVHEILRVEI